MQIQTTISLLLLSLLMFACKPSNSDTVEKESTIVSIEPKKEVKEVEDAPVIMFYGNSLTAGYGLEEEFSFPSRIEEKLEAGNHNYKVINAGLSGETTSGGLKRIDWVLKQKVDIFFLELGANDMLRGLPLEETEANLRAIITKVREKYPAVKVGLCQMLASPNMGKDYADEFQEIYTRIASELEVTLVPFFLDGVAGNRDLLLADGKHPNKAGQEIVAQNIWESLKYML